MLEKIKKIDVVDTKKDVGFIENEESKAKVQANPVQSSAADTIKLSSEDEYQESVLEANTKENIEAKGESKETESSKLKADEENETENIDKTENNDEEKEDKAFDLKSFKGLFSKDEKLDDLISEIGYKNLFNAIDEDGDGKIVKDEIKALDLGVEKLEDLTEDDVKKIIENIETEKDGKIDPEKIAKLKEALSKNDEEDEAANASVASNGGGGGSVGSYGGGGGSYGGGSVGSSSGSSSGINNKSSVANGKTIEELEKEKAAKQTTLDQANDDLQAVANGTNEKVKAAKDEADAKKEAYEEILKQDDKVSQELKEKQNNNAEKIAKSEAKIEEGEAKILQDDEKITALTGEITSLNASLTQYEASLAALPASKTEENEKNWANIEATRGELNSKITETKSQIEAKEKEKSEAESAKQTDQKTLDTEKENLEGLKNEREEIEKEIEKTCSEETKKALEEYKTARENVETVRDAERTTAQTAVDSAQKEIDAINKEIDELKQKEIEREYSTGGDGQAVADFIMGLVTDANGNETAIDAATMQEAMTAAGIRFDDGAWCGDFVAYAIKQGYGDNVPGDYLNTCVNTAYVPTISEWGEERGVFTQDTSRVSPGDIIVYGDRHVGVVASVNNDGTVNTVEGNTSNNLTGAYSSPTGDGWCSAHYNVSGGDVGFVCLSELA